MERSFQKVLIIEDDREIAAVVALNLSDLGLEPVHAYNGREGLRLARKDFYDLIILDLMLPEMDGMSVCSEIRRDDPHTPIMMLTAKSEEIDRVLGLELGADDYLTKPFSIRELTARVKALLRRSRINRSEETKDLPSELYRICDLEVDLTKHRANLKREPLDLTIKEFELLSVFIRNPGRAYSRAELLRLVWGYDFEGYEHTVNTHINRLRNKIEEDPGHPKYLQTVWGLGYRFAEAEEVNE